MSYRSDIFFAGDGVEELEIEDTKLLKLLDQFNNISFR